jgi:hypothetical protein
MAMLRLSYLLLVLAVVAGSTVAISCGSSPPRDINFGSEAGADFIPPQPDMGSGDAGQSADAGTDVGDDVGGDI